MKNSSDGEHYFLLRTALWADAPDVVGIYGSEQRARKAAGSSTGPDRWTREEWRGDVRRSSLPLQAAMRSR